MQPKPFLAYVTQSPRFVCQVLWANAANTVSPSLSSGDPPWLMRVELWVSCTQKTVATKPSSPALPAFHQRISRRLWTRQLFYSNALCTHCESLNKLNKCQSTDRIFQILGLKLKRCKAHLSVRRHNVNTDIASFLMNWKLIGFLGLLPFWQRILFICLKRSKSVLWLFQHDFLRNS